jgi:poly(A) polymerase
MQFLAEIKDKSSQMNATEKAHFSPFGSLIEPRVSFLLTRVSSFLASQNIEAYIVGGFIRDVLLGRKTADIDIAVAGDSLKTSAQVANTLGGKYVPLDEANQIGRVILADEEAPTTSKRWEIDFSPLRGSITEDLAQRDFTIDALATELSQLAAGHRDVPIIDPFSGLTDLREGVIRAVSAKVFQSDAARLLRGVRLAHELGFIIERQTETLIKRHSHLVSDVAGERLREELLRLLAIPGGEKPLAHLDELGLLTALIPELLPEKGVTQPKEHFWDVFTHSLKTVAAADFLLRRGDWEYAPDEVLAAAPWSAKLNEHFNQTVSSGSTRRTLVKLAALLHDIAKPQTKTTEANGRTRFLGHGEQGAEIAAGILERLRFSSKEIKLVANMIRHHLRPTQMSQEGLPSPRAIYRYFRDTGDSGVDILLLSLADHLATRGPNLKLGSWREHTQVVSYVLAKRFEEVRVVTPPKLINGHDLIKIFGLSPGPEVGRLLEIAREAQASGELNTREEALSYIGQHLKGSDGKNDQKK